MLCFFMLKTVKGSRKNKFFLVALPLKGGRDKGLATKKITFFEEKNKCGS